MIREAEVKAKHQKTHATGIRAKREPVGKRKPTKTTPILEEKPRTTKVS